MTLEELKKLCDAAPNDGDEQDWLDAWREVGPKLIAVAEAANAWAKESREDLGHDKLNLTWLCQTLAALEAE